jgi:tRNA (mo5U34)-methyltransferase
LDTQQLEDRIASFPVWNYEFEFEGGVRTPLADRGRVNRQWQRRAYFFEALLELAGGTLAGKRVLDLGCSSGFFALQAVEAGADFVLGLDAKPEAIEQAELVFSAKGVDPARFRFETANVFEHSLGEGFDVVLCLGLLDSVARPVALFELMTGAGAQLIVIDTGLSRAPQKLFEVSRLSEPWNAVDHDLVLLPTRRAVLDLAGQFGLKTVALARTMTDYTSMDDYRRHRRLAFICSPGEPLDSLAPEPDLPRNFWVASARDAAESFRRRRS